MPLGHLVLALILCLTALAIYLVALPRHPTIDTMQAEYAVGRLQTARAWTMAKNNGKYINYDTKSKQYRSEQNPRDLTTGEFWAPTTQKGQRHKEDDLGFQLIGIPDHKFSCPATWVWDAGKGQCRLPSVCTADDRPGTRKVYRSPEGQGHARLYIVCDGGRDSHLETCAFGTMVDPQTAQCTDYDICHNQTPGFVFRTTALAANEYYVCIDGKRQLQTCASPLVYDAQRQGCVILNQCHNKNNTTIPRDAHKFTLCRNNVAHEVDCGTARVVTSTHGIQSCENPRCNLRLYGGYVSVGSVTYPISGIVCTDNIPQLRVCDRSERTVHIPLSHAVTSRYSDKKSNFYDDPVPKYTKEYAAWSDDGVFSCHPIDHVSDIPLRVAQDTPHAPVSYSIYLDSGMWNFVTNSPAALGRKYFNYQGAVLEIATQTKVGNTQDYLAFMSADVLRPRPPASFAPLSDPDDGLTYGFLLPAALPSAVGPFVCWAFHLRAFGSVFRLIVNDRSGTRIVLADLAGDLVDVRRVVLGQNPMRRHVPTWTVAELEALALAFGRACLYAGTVTAGGVFTEMIQSNWETLLIPREWANRTKVLDTRNNLQTPEDVHTAVEELKLRTDPPTEQFDPLPHAALQACALVEHR